MVYNTLEKKERSKIIFFRKGTNYLHLTLT